MELFRQKLYVFPFPGNPYLKTNGASLLILVLNKNFEEKEVCRIIKCQGKTKEP